MVKGKKIIKLCLCQVVFIYFRLSYGEWMLEQLIEKSSNGCDIYVMYDIACSLHKHLKVCGVTSRLAKIMFLTCRLQAKVSY